MKAPSAPKPNGDRLTLPEVLALPNRILTPVELSKFLSIREEVLKGVNHGIKGYFHDRGPSEIAGFNDYSVYLENGHYLGSCALKKS